MIKLLYSFGRNVVKSKQSEDSIKSLIQQGMSDQQIYKQLTPKKVQKVENEEITKKIKERANTFVTQVKEDTTFKKLAKQDSQDSMRDLDIYVDNSKRGDSRLKGVKIIEKEDSFMVEQQKIDKLESIFKEDGQLIRKLVKEEMFLNKKLQEEDFQFAENLKKQDRKRQLRKVQRNLDSVEWDDNPDLSRKTLQFTKRDNPPNAEFESHLIKDPYALQKFRTTQNMTEFVHQFLFHRKSLFDIVVNGVNTNASCTVVFIFWKLAALQQVQSSSTKLSLDSYQSNKEEMIKQLIEDQSTMQKQLNLFSGYMGGQMCQQLGLKFAPSMRFIVSTRLKNFEELKQEFTDHQEDLIKSELVEDYQDGLRGSKVSKDDYAKYVTSMEESIMDHAYAEARETPTKKSFVKNKKKSTQPKSKQFWDQL